MYYGVHADTVVCGCWEVCPECSLTMEPYVPDLSPNIYGLDGKRDLQILKVCSNLAGHSSHSPIFSRVKPVEVKLEKS